MSQHWRGFGGQGGAAGDCSGRAGRWLSSAVLGVLLANSACTGQVTGGKAGPMPSPSGASAGAGAPATPGSPGGTSGGPPGAAGAPGTDPAAGVADGSAFFPGTTLGLTRTRIWQLTAAQYITTVSDALGVQIDLPRLLPTVREDHFLNDATALAVSDVSFADLEEGLRAELLAHQDAVTARMGCAVAALNTDC
ncbi:MAG: DUF1587 domain-containing protein, partial [Verrucomicrobiota bacterium]